MNIYIDLAYVALALAFCGGFFVGRFLITRREERRVERVAFDHYRAAYNKQMAILVDNFKAERVALVHRYQGLTAEVERELAEIQRLARYDGEKTRITNVASNEAAMMIEETA